jgi:hypothetical protein
MLADQHPFPLPFRLAGVVIALVGVGLIAGGGARGPMALWGFGMFCLGMAGLDGVYRRRFGFRQIAILLGWFAVGVGLWTLAAVGLVRMLEMPEPPELRTLFILSAACAAGALLTITLRDRRRSAVKTRLEGFGKRVGSAVSRRDGPRPGSQSVAERPKRPAEPAQGG